MRGLSGRALEKSQRADVADLHRAVLERPQVNVVRRPAPFSWVREDVMDCDQTAVHHVWSPGAVVRLRRLLGMAAVDEHHREWTFPSRGHGRRPADDGDDDLLEPGLEDRSSEGREGVDLADRGVDERRVGNALVGLVFL